MRKLLFCALAVVCGAAVADAQEGSGYAFRNPGQQWPSAFNSGYGAPSWGQQGYMPYMQPMQQPMQPYYAPMNYYTAPTYPSYPVGMVPDNSSMPMDSAMPSDMSAGLPPLPTAPFQDPAGLVPGMPLPRSAYAADDDSYNKESDEAFHRPCNERVWGSFDYDMGWLQPQRVTMPLVTAGSITDPHPGALGQPGTVPLFGASHIDPGMLSGIRGEVGVFLDDADLFSVECIGLYLFPTHASFSQTSDGTGNPILARPFFNVVAMRPSAFVDSLPNVASGGFTIDARSDFVSAEINAAAHAYGDRRWHVEGLFGFRYLNLGESLTVADHLQPLVNNTLTFEGTPVNIGSSLADMDSFRTNNDFFGLQIGGSVRWEGDWFYVSTFAKVALGATDETADISGSTTLLSPAGNQSAVGGILALPTNIGHHTQTSLAYVPEGGLNVGVKVTPHIQLVAGYSFLYWSAVARPGSQIDPLVNPSQVPSDTSFGTSGGPGRPVFAFHEDSFYVQQITVGVQIHY
jgi:Putative beta barrel porin-7 (BBP7)